MSSILKRAHRVLLITVAALFVTTLLSPIVGLANSDLSTGSQAVIANPNGEGANLRSEASVESEIWGELPQGASVTLTDGPYTGADGASMWFWVTSDLGEGYVEASLLGTAESADPAPVEESLVEDQSFEEETSAEESSAPAAWAEPWSEPTDHGIVVDHNNTLPGEGLACRVTPTLDGEIIGYVYPEQSVQVTEPRIYEGELNFVHINCGDFSGYVNGDFVVLDSDQVPEPEAPAVPEEGDSAEPELPNDEIPVDPETGEEPEGTVTEGEDAPVENPENDEAPVENPETDNPETENPESDETPIDDPDAGDAPVDNPEADTTPVEDSESDDAQVEDPESDENPVDDLDEDGAEVEDPASGETGELTDESTPDPVEDDLQAEPEQTDGDGENADVAPEPEGEDAAPESESPEASPEDDQVDPETIDETNTEPEGSLDAESNVEEEAETPEESAEADETGTPEGTEESDEAVDAEDEATPEKDAATEEPADSEDEVTPEKDKAPEKKAPATTAPAFDMSSMIGSATVTGTNGDGLRCRVAPNADAPTLMMLGEGTKVSVFAEAVDGYLGIDCGGLQGFANVNFLWSGGAGDEEIQKSDMKLVVTGTGNGLNCRTGAGTSHPVITLLRDGDAITTRGKASNGWVAVVCGGQNGFVATPWVAVGGGSSSKDGSSSGSSSSTGTATVANTNGDGLYCRTGAGTGYSAITILSPGQKVSVRGAKQGAWVPIVCGGQNGFAHGDFMSVSAGSGSTAPNAPATPDTNAGSYTVSNTNGDGLNCRAGAGLGHNVITVLRPGQKVDGRSGSQNGWQAVVCGGQNGFVSSEYVSANGGSAKPADPKPENPGGDTGQTATVVNTNGDGLYCRTGAGSSNNVITVLAPGQQVPVRGKTSNGWVPITCGGKSGWASGEFLSVGGGSSKPADPKPETPAPSGLASGDHAEVTSALNLRYEPSLGSGVAVVAPAGTVVKVTGGSNNGFYPVDWDGLKGYMSGDYLAKSSKDLSKRGGSAAPAPSDPNPPSTGNGGGTATGNAMVDFAMGYLGYPYVWATHGPSSFDCSGFTYWVTKNVMGKDIGYGTWTQVSAGTKVAKSDLQPGDLVFFQNTYTTGLSHVGIYIGGGQFIHAENENTGVRISDLDSSYYGSRWYGAVRL